MFPDDHIVWKKVVDKLVDIGGQVIFEKDYLLFRRAYNEQIYKAYMNKVSDTHVLAVKKLK